MNIDHFPPSYRQSSLALWMLVGLALGSRGLFADQRSLEVKATFAGGKIELRWPVQRIAPAGITCYDIYEIQRTEDFTQWQTVGQPWSQPSNGAKELAVTVEPNGPMSFYRVVGFLDTTPPEPPETAIVLAAGGAEVFGYGTVFNQELDQIGQIAPDDLLTLFPPPSGYVEQISFDPTTAQYWSSFHNSTSFRLNDQEQDIFKKQGFVVSERLGGYSFSDVYYRIFSSDLPVFVTTDSILQAWHFSYQAVLIELEMTYLYHTIDQVLKGMADQIPALWQASGQGALKDSLLDADYFLTVAQSLLAGAKVSSALSQDSRVELTLAAIKNLKVVDCFTLFGLPRTVDFSQFKVRGHYESSANLSRYFQCLMWLGRTEFRIAGGPYQDSPCDAPHPAPLRELGTAIVLHQALVNSGQFSKWQNFDAVINTFVGQSDSLTFAQLGELIKAAQLGSLANIQSLADLDQFQKSLENGTVGLSQINSDYLFSPLEPAQVKLPVAFTVAGQKFVLDSWAMGQVVFDKVIWDDNDIPELGDKLPRRKPSCLDVAFAVLGNDQVGPDIVRRILATDGVPFRDGYYYQHNLAAVRRVIDRQVSAVWGETIYLNWLAALRELSNPTLDPRYPECMRTRAWAMKTLNTQMASWTQLRHDTVLYAKQSYTPPIACVYPNGFVEPRPDFWQRLVTLANRSRELIGSLSFAGSLTLNLDAWMPTPITISLSALQSKELVFLSNFESAMAKLSAIATKELLQQPLGPDENTFLISLLESPGWIYGGTKQYSGWYPALFYRNALQDFPFVENQGSDKWDALVTDVHTDSPDDLHGDPGAVIHEGVGNVNLLMLAVDSGLDRMVYAGPVLSHYEFETPVDVRKTDSEWKSQIKQNQAPPQPEWTRNYLVPGTYKIPYNIQ